MIVRNLVMAILWWAVLILCWSPVHTVLDLGLHDDRYVQLLAAPVIFAILLYWNRKQIFMEVGWAAVAGPPLFALALSTYLVFLRRASYTDDGGILGLAIVAVILTLMAGFMLCYGLQSFRAALFPLCCLLLAIPVPVWAMDKIITALQQGSAEMSIRMLRLANVPVFAQGMRLSLPNLEIEVAPECSGIRSCLVLALIGLVAGRLCLRSGWSRLALVLSTIPIAILKNALRISVIAWLSAYVDRAFLHGPIHRYGGLVFTPFGIILFAAILAGLERLEVRMSKRGQTAPPNSEAQLVSSSQ